MPSILLCRSALAFCLVAASAQDGAREPRARTPQEPAPPATAPEEAAPTEEAAPAERPAATPLEELTLLYATRSRALWEADRPGAELAWRAALDRAGDWIRAQAWADLPPGRRVELAWAGRWIDAEVVRADRRQWRIDPAWHVRRLIDALALRPGKDSPAAVWDAYTTRVAALPDALLAAQGELVWLQPTLVRHGVDTSLGLARSLSGVTVDRATRWGVPREQLTTLGDATRRGRRAGEAFARWLERAEPSSIGEARVKRGAWSVMAAEAGGRPFDLEDLEVRLAGVIASSPARPAGAPAAAATGDAERIVKSAARLGEKLALDVELLQIEGPPLSVSASPADRPLGPAVVGLPGGDGTWRLLLVAPGLDWPDDARRVREEALSAEALWACALVHGSPGRGWLASRGARGSRDVTPLPDTLGLDGWGLFAARWLTAIEPEDGLLRSRVGVVAELGRLRREAAARTLASLEIHAFGRPREDVVARLSLHTGWDRWTAAREVEAVLTDPTHGMGILTALEHEGLWDRWTEKFGRREALKKVLGALQRYPRGRAADLEVLFKD